MARKNILAGLMDAPTKFTAVNSTDEEPAKKLMPPSKSVGALGAVTRSIDALAARADAAKDIEARLAEGQTVVDLDPQLIEDSFVSDRLHENDEAFAALVEAIKTGGQNSPILVRPHPRIEGRFQIAFGHRRVRAARHLGRPVKAVVKTLDDRDHVIAQGQENSARSDLSFIERALFARNLEDTGFDRETIMAAMSTDKTTVSKMLSVTERIPPKVLETLVHAKRVGRDRWHDLAAQFGDEEASVRAQELVSTSDYLSSNPEERFDLLQRHLARSAKKPSRQPGKELAELAWNGPNATVTAKTKDTGKRFTLSFGARDASAFGAYIASNLDSLYQAFEKAQSDKKDGDN